jgi:hypothetical protein
MPHGSAGERTVERRWNGEKDFPRVLQEPLTPLEQLAQVLLVSNEAFFVD